MTGYSFRSEGLQCSGQIVGKVGDNLLVEGLAQDSGAYFLQLNGEMRRFLSRQEAEDYGVELAQDESAQGLSHEQLAAVGRQWKDLGSLAVRSKIRATGYTRAQEAFIMEGWTQARMEAGLSERALDTIAMDPLTSKGGKILKNMESEYGEKKGKSVFYASANKGNITGVHDEAEGEAPSGEEASDQ